MKQSFTVSLDITSLYINVPVNETKEILIRTMVYKSEDRTILESF